MEISHDVADLRCALLEIEWTSRRSVSLATLLKINALARAALTAAPAAVGTETVVQAQS